KTPMSHRTSIGILALLTAITAGCDLNSYMPSAEKLRNRSNPSAAFIVGEHDIRGIYGNMDVDSAIYTYQTDTKDEEEFWASLDKATSDDGWTLREERDNYRCYVRIIPRTGQQVFHSAEEVRVAFKPQSQQVFLAWVQADERSLPKDFPSDGEGRFAKNVIWPRFEEALYGAEDGK
ncbi:MAG: hypothetical protein DWQ41_23480, partial [Planctomycetota bacterium]